MSEENGISVVTVCPVITVDPSPTTVVNMRVAALLSLLSGDQEMINTVKFMERACGGLMLVHVDDLCRCEIFLAEKTSASGRYICCGLNTTVLQLARSLAAKYPRYSVNVPAPRHWMRRDGNRTIPDGLWYPVPAPEHVGIARSPSPPLASGLFFRRPIPIRGFGGPTGP